MFMHVQLLKGPSMERQGLKASIRSVTDELLADHINYHKSKMISHLYKADTKIELLRWYWYEYKELGYLSYKNSRKTEVNPAKVASIYAQILKYINDMGCIIGAEIKAAKSAKST